MDIIQIIAICFIAIFVTLIVEAFFVNNWSPFYFKKGITIYKKVFRNNICENINTYETILNKNFKVKNWTLLSIVTWPGSIIFKKISEKEIAFRENKFFYFSSLMHGVIIFEEQKGEVIIKGSSNWCPIAFYLYWYIFLGLFFFYGNGEMIDLLICIIFLIVSVFCFAFYYFMQSHRFNKIYEFLKELTDSESVNH